MVPYADRSASTENKGDSYKMSKATLISCFKYLDLMKQTSR